MDKNLIFENTYPINLPEDKDCDLVLDEVLVPPENVVARFNDQWVQEIGLDLGKFGYTQTLQGLLKNKIGDEIHRDNLIEKVRILQTAAFVFDKLNNEGKKKVIEFFEREPSLYPNLRGSRDKTHFHHKKQLTVVLLHILQQLHGTDFESVVMDMLFDIVRNNYEIVTKKSYFDEYSSYTYSEDQRKIANTIVSGIEKKLLSMIHDFDKDRQLQILREFWSYPSLQNSNDLKKMIVKKVHLGTETLSMNELKELIEELEREGAPETNILKDLIMVEDFINEKGDTEEIIDFYSKGLKGSDSIEHFELLSKNILKMFNDANGVKEKKKVISLLISPTESLEQKVGLEDSESRDNILPLVGLIMESEEAENMFFEHIKMEEVSHSFFLDLSTKIANRKSIRGKVRGKIAKFVDDILRSKDNIDKNSEFVNNFVGIVKNDLLYGKEGEDIIDFLIKDRKKSEFSDELLKRVFLKAYNNYLGRYLQYMLLTKV